MASRISIERQRNRQEFRQLALIMSLILGLACLSCWSILIIEGWPYNHEHLSAFERVEVFRIAMQNGDFFPLWTTLSTHGYGSPFPFFYHRLYSTFVAGIALSLNSTYWAVKLSMPLLLSSGAIGMYQAAKVLKLTPIYCVAAAILLMSANYTVTDWLIRGAMAEFTALMLLPWLFFCLLNILDHQPTVWRLSLVICLIFFAHSVIFYYSLIPIFLTFLFSAQRQNLRQWCLILIIVCTILGGYAFTLVLVKSDFNLDILPQQYDPIYEFQLFSRYFLDVSFPWRSTWTTYSVEIGRMITLPLILIGLYGTVSIVFSRVDLGQFGWARSRSFVFLSLSGAIFLSLQCSWMGWFYHYSPGANFIQFPWRLLTFITVICILLLCQSLTHLFRDKYLLIILIVIGQFVFAINAQNIQYARFSQNEIIRALQPEHLQQGLVFGGEYLPSKMKLSEIPESRPFLVFSNCEVLALKPAIDALDFYHFRQFTIQLQPRPNCVIKLNQFYSDFLAIEPEAQRSIHIFPDRTVQIIPRSSASMLMIKRRNLLAILWLQIQQMRHRATAVSAML